MPRRTHIRFPLRRVGRRLPPVGDDFVSVEALGGLILLAATVVALLWANVAEVSYADLWDTDLRLGVGRLSISEDLRHWINDGLMAIFFFIVALEIKRELVSGELRDRRRAALPAFAALGGMMVPAAIFLAFNPSLPARDGWAIPVATDIAFALGALTLLGSRVPRSLRVFLLSLAIVDDIGAIAVIAFFYSDDLELEWLVSAVGVLVVFFVLQRLGLQNPWLYVVPAIAVWVCVHESGVHATIAGVALGLLAPVARYQERPVIDQVERHVHPWTSLLIVPLFAVANAGVALGSDTVRDAVTTRVGLGVVLGLTLGKPIGIGLAVGAAVLFRWGRLPRGVNTRHLLGAAALAGIGFTVSLFVADLAFAGPARLADAKVAILAASLLSATAGILILLRRPTRTVEP